MFLEHEQFGEEKTYLLILKQIVDLYGDKTRFYCHGINKAILNESPETDSKEWHGIDPDILGGDIVTYIGDDKPQDYSRIAKAMSGSSNKTRVMIKKGKSFLNEIYSEDLLKTIFEFSSIYKVTAKGDYYINALNDEPIIVFCKEEGERTIIHSAINSAIMENCNVDISIKSFSETEKQAYLYDCLSEIDNHNLLMIDKRINDLNFECNNAYRTVIWRSGRVLDNYVNQIKYWESRGRINVLGIFHRFPVFNQVYNYPSVSIEEIVKLQPQLLVVMDDGKNFLASIEEINKKFPNNNFMILPYKAFSLENLIIKDYYSLLINPVTIFSVNCWGGITYNRLGLQFNSPLINMFLSDEDYLKFLSSPKHYMSVDIKYHSDGFGERSKKSYPIAALDDIKLHCNHYDNFEEVEKCWYERRNRINWGNIFVMYYTWDKKCAEDFSKLPFKKKVCFVPFENEGVEKDGCICHLDFARNQLIKDKPFFWVVNEMAFGSFSYYNPVELLVHGKIRKKVI